MTSVQEDCTESHRGVQRFHKRVNFHGELGEGESYVEGCIRGCSEGCTAK